MNIELGVLFKYRTILFSVLYVYKVYYMNMELGVLYSNTYRTLHFSVLYVYKVYYMNMELGVLYSFIVHPSLVSFTYMKYTI